MLLSPLSPPSFAVGVGILLAAAPLVHAMNQERNIQSCPTTEPEAWSACTAEQQGLSCNLGEVYGGDPYCWKDCDDQVWAHLCAGGGDQPPPEDDPKDPPATDGNSCSDATTCDACLALPECDGWAMGQCYTQCNYDMNDPGSFNVADAACYDSNNGGCAAEQADKDDMTICSAETDCTACMETDKSSGGKCLWISSGGDGSGGFCAPEQGMMCCAVGMCPEEPLATDGNSCSDATTCDACLALPECDGWATGQCYTQCNYDMNDPGSFNIADAACYDSNNGGCAAEQADKDDMAICSAKTDCTSCMETDKSSGGKCLWISSDADGSNGFCAPEQGMMCCAVETCSAAPTITTTPPSENIDAQSEPTNSPSHGGDHIGAKGEDPSTGYYVTASSTAFFAVNFVAFSLFLIP